MRPTAGQLAVGAVSGCIRSVSECLAWHQSTRVRPTHLLLHDGDVLLRHCDELLAQHVHQARDALQQPEWRGGLHVSDM